ncbi:fimbria/pilus outer membrane usher protein [Halomonas sp. M4R5S39]|uniref:fimbria/pilus outer membrane usher protein n=1 Tax=Halomonas kalidii TaxID=3043293 RepID=UPI0024A9C828|nr:fimbria/pilus outer membrane usher protein [Halomonas kalidii]MDI5985315.1 fimbria/pilus outer membrane usher protein [Halomonas kalidii]
MEATVNDQLRPTTALALIRGGHDVWVAASDLEQWRIAPPAIEPFDHHGEAFYRLEPLGISFELDRRRSTLDLEVPAALFADTRLEGPRRDRVPLTPSSLGAFFNYDLSSTHSRGETRHSGLLEQGVFNGWGSGINRLVVRDNPPGDRPAVVRLETQWRRDTPDSMRTLRLGDTTSLGTAWSGGVRFGGLQWGSNFATRPEMVTLPLLSLAGEAALPSTVDLYVNDALRLRREVPPGPFSIDEIPVITGQGQAQLVVRDILGREQLITQPFYASVRLLRQGLKDYSVELGAIRRDFGRASNAYGRALGTATYRTGLTNWLTTELHAQVLQDQQMAGVGGSWLLPFGGVMHAAYAASEADGRQGDLMTLGLQRQGWPLSLGAESQFTSEDFMRLGMRQGHTLPRQQHRVFFSLSSGRAGSLSLSYTAQNFDDRDDIEIVNLGYSKGLGAFGYLTLSALHFMETGETALRAGLGIPLGMPRTSASLSVSDRDDHRQGSLQIQRSLPVGRGFGYRVRTGLGGDDHRQASLGLQNDYQTYLLEASQRRDQTASRANVRGGVAWLGGDLFASRHIDRSFAVVQMPGFSDVQVYADNQPVARTNHQGNALVPRLRAYERNRISIEQADLPLGARVESLEMQVSPYYRSGVELSFPVSHSRDAFFRILLESGEPLPVGAVVEDARGERFPVGQRGETFVTDLESSNRLRALWQGQACEFTLDVPEIEDVFLELGDVICHGVTP